MGAGFTSQMIASVKMNLGNRRKRKNLYERGADAQSSLAGTLITEKSSAEELLQARARAHEQNKRVFVIRLVALLVSVSSVLAVYFFFLG